MSKHACQLGCELESLTWLGRGVPRSLGSAYPFLPFPLGVPR